MSKNKIKSRKNKIQGGNLKTEITTEKNFNLLEWIIPLKDNLEFSFLCKNTSISAIYLIEEEIKNNPDIKIEIDWKSLSSNPSAIHLLEKNPDKIDWKSLSSNPNAIKLIENELKNNPNTDRIDWKQLSKNKNSSAIHLLEQKPDRIDWIQLSSNPNQDAIELLRNNRQKIDWNSLSSNPNDIAIYMLENYQNVKNQKDRTINWINLSENPNAIHLLEKNLGRVDWSSLSRNPNAIHLLEKNLDRVDWSSLSRNPNAIHLLEKNQDKIDWSILSSNPSIFKKIKINENMVTFTFYKNNNTTFDFSKLNFPSSFAVSINSNTNNKIINNIGLCGGLINPVYANTKSISSHGILIVKNKNTDTTIGISVLNIDIVNNNLNIEILCSCNSNYSHIGTVIMKKLTEFSKINNFNYINLEAIDNAVPFYEKVGFKIYNSNDENGIDIPMRIQVSNIKNNQFDKFEEFKEIVKSFFSFKKNKKKPKKIELSLKIPTNPITHQVPRSNLTFNSKTLGGTKQKRKCRNKTKKRNYK